MQKALALIVLISLLGCKKQREYTLDDFQSLNGYWQIVGVIYPDGTEKKYTTSPSFDYIEVHGNKGFKKKVYPKLDGTYETSNDAVTFRIIKKTDKGYYISYNDSLNGWQEKLNFMTTDFFSVRNEDQIIYSYYRQTHIDLNL